MGYRHKPKKKKFDKKKDIKIIETDIDVDVDVDATQVVKIIANKSSGDIYVNQEVNTTTNTANHSDFG